MELSNSNANQENNAYSSFENFIADYRIPLIFGVIGITFLLGAVILTFRQEKGLEEKQEGDVKIVQEAETQPILSQKIKIDIEGAVSKAGVYTLLKGSRIADLLFLAGGISQEADQDWIKKNLNLAQKLVDGAKIYIPKIGEVEEELVLSAKSDKININTASRAALESLPDIGEARAQKIIDGRPYQKLEDLVEKKIIWQSIFEKIKDKITL